MKTFALTIFACLLSLNSWAQSDSSITPNIMDYGNSTTYEIGGIEVKGAEFSDPKSIIALSGLAVGENIDIPGDDVADAISKLWELHLYDDIQILLRKKIGNIAFLDIVVRERPRLSRHGYQGIKKGQHDDLNDAVERYLRKGTIVTQNMKSNAIRGIKQYFIDKGFLDVGVSVKEVEDDVLKNGIKLVFDIDKGRRVRIKDINFVGNEKVSDKKLRGMLKNTKRSANLFKASRFIEKDFEEDKRALIAYYNTIGHRDARIESDSIYVIDPKGKKMLAIQMRLIEGPVYYFGDLRFKGNTIYDTKTLDRILGIKSGDVYNGELLMQRLQFDPNGRDVSTLYMDNGYLFFRSEPIERSVTNDSVDLEIRIMEGPQATIDKVIIKGNDRTHEHVIRRELRVKPGDKFSRSAIIRSQRELMALNYFDPEAMNVETPVNEQRGTVDIVFEVSERPSDQLELSAGWGGFGGGLIGTLGVTFNNFSTRNIGDPSKWNPLPQGDGQRLQLRGQTNGIFYQSYNFSFTEPWLGGRKPNALSVTGFHTRFTNGLTPESSSYSQLVITGASVGLGTRLKWPDDYFVSQTTLNYQNLNLVNRADFAIPTGNFHNLSIQQTISRNSIANPLFPESGSNISLSGQFTLPYSLFTPNRDFASLDPTDRFRWLEYHKWDFRAEWFATLVNRLVFRASAKMGFLGTYNSAVGLSPFERYRLGGDGLANFAGIQGLDIISLRGYRDPVADVAEANRLGAAIYNKFTMELRYLISPNPNATIYVLGFLEGGNAWSGFDTYDPFDLRRSAGVGVRVFLPMFGTLGFDYGIGFDKDIGGSRNLTDYGAFNIVLGFEPE